MLVKELESKLLVETAVYTPLKYWTGKFHDTNR